MTKSTFLDISQRVRLVRDDYMSVQLSRPRLARMLAWSLSQPAGAPAFASAVMPTPQPCAACV